MKLSIWTEIVGVIAVVVSLGFLAGELNQANSLARFEAEAAIRQSYNDLNMEMATSEEFAGLWAQLSDEDRNLSDTDIQRAIGLAYVHMNNWGLVERGHYEGWLSDAELQNALNDIEVVAKIWPGLMPFLEMAVKETYEGVQMGRTHQKILEQASLLSSAG